MFGAYIMITEAASFFESELKHLLGAGRKIDLAAVVAAGAGEALDDLFDASGFESRISVVSAAMQCASRQLSAILPNSGKRNVNGKNLAKFLD
jgi:hypothetical protein